MSLEEKGKISNSDLAEILNFTLDLCDEEDCAGDDSVGIPPCPMWIFADIDESNNIVCAHCRIKELLGRLE